MSVLICTLQGRFGNQVMQYLFARAFAEMFGHELRVDPWIGERVFDISHPRPDGRSLCRMNEVELFAFIREHGGTGIPAGTEFRGYAQTQECMIYTKRQAQSWLKLRYEWMPALNRIGAHYDVPIICHRRAGDYIGYGYPVVSERSYREAARDYGLNWANAHVLSEEEPTPHTHLPDDLSFLADFYRMLTARVLLRGNSTFSWLAALLGDGLVLSPVIAGLEGGKEHDTQFVAGNWPRFANLDFVTDLHVSP